jgi:tRNA-specific 2-thiouridylase
MRGRLKNTKKTKLNTSGKTVFVGLSGGVDSSVTAYLLQKEGYKVVGAFIKIWQPDVICDWKEDRRSAMRVAAHLNIPFVTIDLSEEYKKEVVDYMLSEYKAGRTPNPDVMCNKEIKFKAFLAKATEMGADMIATGHYARTNGIALRKAKDPAKEQSYFLWTLTQKELSKVLFPIGHLKKSEVRKIAMKAGLHTFEKKDSQGLCFIGKVDFKDFLRSHIKKKKGDVIDIEGHVIGHHDGAFFFTLGERHGFTVTKKGTDDKPLYVVDKDIEKNTLTVADKNGANKDAREFVIENTNWIFEKPHSKRIYEAQVRYHQDYQRCTISENEGQTTVTFAKPQIAASGQSIVFYDKDICLGGGVVK